jgi:hypothetical protein
MNKEQQELLDDAYKNYEKNINDGIQNPNDIKWNITEPKNPKLYPLTKEEFIDRIKTNSEFSERWGLKIEERELSLVDRTKILVSKSDNKKDFYDRNGRLIVEEHTLVLDEANIPTKLITITYNDKTIESYES